MLCTNEEGLSLKLLSIIIPVYNVEHYICKCLDSLVNQCDRSVEILCIDDGSSDASGIICEEYAKKIPELSVFHKKNGGVASARNLGLQKARGEYIAWVDPDDYVTYNWFSTIKKALLKHKPDCLLFDYFFDSHQKSKKVCANIPLVINPEQFIYELSTEIHVQSGLPLKVIKRICYAKLSFDEHAIILEDYKILTLLSLRFNKIIYVPVCLYHNVRRQDSLSNNTSVQKRLIAANIANERYVFFKRSGYRVSKVSYWKMALLVCLTECNYENIIYDEFCIQRKKYKEMLKKDFFKIIKSKDVNLKMKLAIFLNVTLSMNISSKLWGFIRHQRYN